MLRKVRIDCRADNLGKVTSAEYGAALGVYFSAQTIDQFYTGGRKAVRARQLRLRTRRRCERRLVPRSGDHRQLGRQPASGGQARNPSLQIIGSWLVQRGHLMFLTLRR